MRLYSGESFKGWQTTAAGARGNFAGWGRYTITHRGIPCRFLMRAYSNRYCGAGTNSVSRQNTKAEPQANAQVGGMNRRGPINFPHLSFSSASLISVNKKFEPTPPTLQLGNYGHIACTPSPLPLCRCGDGGEKMFDHS